MSDETVPATGGSTSRSRSRAVVAIVVVLVVVVLAALLISRCGSSSSNGSTQESPSTTPVDGVSLPLSIAIKTFDPSTELNVNGTECSGGGTYAALKRGAAVVVRDANGKEVARSTFGPGEVSTKQGTSRPITVCSFGLSSPLIVPTIGSVTIDIPTLSMQQYTPDQIRQFAALRGFGAFTGNASSY